MRSKLPNLSKYPNLIECPHLLFASLLHSEKIIRNLNIRMQYNACYFFIVFLQKCMFSFFLRMSLKKFQMLGKNNSSKNFIQLCERWHLSGRQVWSVLLCFTYKKPFILETKNVVDANTAKKIDGDTVQSTNRR